MMDRFALAQEEYKALCLKTLPQAPHHAGRQFAKWIGNNVVPVVEELATHADFRELARWSVDHLGPGSTHDERKLVEKVDASLVAVAGSLVQYAELPDVRCRLIEFGPSPESLKISGEATTTPDGLEVVQAIEKRPWQDLVNTDDYLAPAAGLNLPRGLSSSLKPAEFVPMFDLTLRQPGDHISGMLLRRIDHWYRDLEHFAVRCSSAAHLLNDKSKAWVSLSSVRQRLFNDVRELRAQLTTGPQSRLRDSAMVLVQAYAGFHPKPDFRWLGFDHAPHGGDGFYRLWLVNHGEIAIASRIAVAITELAQIYHTNPPIEAVLQDAAGAHALVMAQGMGTRFLYWRGQIVDNRPLTEKLWDTLWVLALRARSGQAIDHSDLGTGTSVRALACRVMRLKQKLPHDLGKQIQAGDAGQTYKFNLGSREIFLAEVDGDEGVYELPADTLQRRLAAIRSLANRHEPK